MDSKLLIQIVLFVIYSITVSAQDYPATEIYVLDIQKKGNHFSLPDNAKPVNISNNKGYDNQPYFIEQMNSIAYVSSRSNGPTDVYLYDLETKNTKEFTNTPESEFSPKITPDGKHISVVKGGEQNLTRISVGGGVAEKLYTSRDSIGYYCWLNEDEIAAVVLTKPITLELIDIKNKKERYLTDSIGRNLFKYDNGVVVCKQLHSGNWITYVDGEGHCEQLIRLPASGEDFYLTADGWLFSSNVAAIVYCNIKHLDKGWQQLADLKGMGLSKIFRLAVNKDKNKLAFVTEDK